MAGGRGPPAEARQRSANVVDGPLTTFPNVVDGPLTTLFSGRWTIDHVALLAAEPREAAQPSGAVEVLEC
jgi:hypothetical protein